MVDLRSEQCYVFAPDCLEVRFQAGRGAVQVVVAVGPSVVLHDPVGLIEQLVTEAFKAVEKRAKLWWDWRLTRRKHATAMQDSQYGHKFLHTFEMGGQT